MAGKASGTGRIVDELIDAEDLATSLSIEELNEAAEAYFARIDDPSYLFAKPLGGPAESPGILMHFAGMLHGLMLERGDTVLDFGAGACWTSRMLAQLDCRVIACDVSPSALNLGRQLVQQHPTFGFGSIEFIVFDGQQLALPDASVDRIAVMDAFHHVPNWPQVLAEFHRVLKPGGRVVMAEPGPEHSETEAAQYEMRQHTVLERNVVVEDLDALVQRAGFAPMRVGLYSGLPSFATVPDFTTELSTGAAVADATRAFLVNHRLLLLTKGWQGVQTSADGVGLAASMDVTWLGGWRYRIRIVNTGTATWLGEEAERGAVRLGVQVASRDGSISVRDHQRVPLQYNASRAVRPGEEVTVEFDAVPPVGTGDRLAFDLVSEHVAWFEDRGNGAPLMSGIVPESGGITPAGT